MIFCCGEGPFCSSCHQLHWGIGEKKEIKTSRSLWVHILEFVEMLVIMFGYSFFMLLVSWSIGAFR